MGVTEDFQILERLRTNPSVSIVLKPILAEVLNLNRSRKPNYIDVGKTSGSAVRRYRNKKFATYDVNYQISQEDERERIANLVHELTHTCVQEAFDSDFINYSTSPKDLAAVPEHEFNEAGTFLSNEEARQASRLHMDYLQVVIKKLQHLNQLAEKSRALQGNKTLVSQKLFYGITNPQKEYDTVINQILVWLHYWGITSGKFKNEVEKIAKENFQSRRNKNRPAVGQKHKKCFLTTACVSAMGLEDDCNELTTLRKFRDEYLQHRPDGTRMIDEYYRVAPSLVDKIDQRKDADSIYSTIYKEVILPCVDSINHKKYDEALNRYKDMYIKLLDL
jgi:hypothetical protein